MYQVLVFEVVGMNDRWYEVNTYLSPECKYNFTNVIIIIIIIFLLEVRYFHSRKSWD